MYYFFHTLIQNETFKNVNLSFQWYRSVREYFYEQGNLY